MPYRRPLISGTVANEPVSAASGNTIRPFATTTIADTNFAYSAKDTATIKLTDGGVLTDADGLLTGPGLSKTPGTVGTYTLSNADYAYTIGYQLQNLVFTPSAVAAGLTRTTAFELDVTDAKANLTTTDTKTSVLQFGPPRPDTANHRRHARRPDRGRRQCDQAIQLDFDQRQQCCTERHGDASACSTAPAPQLMQTAHCRELD